MNSARAFIRHPSDIPIEITAAGGAAETHRLNNVSLGGLCCKSMLFFETGLTVTIRISLVNPPFEAHGKVIWCHKTDGVFEVGVQFIDTRDLFKVRMIEQICYIEDYKQRVLLTEGRILNSQAAALEWISKYAAEFPNPIQSNNS